MGEEQHRGDTYAFPIVSYRGDVLSVCLITGDVDLDRWVRAGLLGFFSIKSLFFPLHFLFVRSQSLSPAHPQGRRMKLDLLKGGVSKSL